MIGDQDTCARETCSNQFVKKTHNQKYCSTQCCGIETNRRIMEKYHERAAIRKGKKRGCKSCGTSLSRYNDSKFCGACEVNMRNVHVGEAAAMIKNISWL